MKIDSINFTDDLVNGYCQESGVNVVMMKKLYKFYTTELINKIKNNPATIEVPIKHFGTFYMPLHGAHIVLNRKKNFLNYFEESDVNYRQEIVEFYEKRIQEIKKKINKCKKVGIKRIPFLFTLISKKYVENF